MKRNCILAIPVSEAELATIYISAATQQMSGNDWVRSALLDDGIAAPDDILKWALTIAPETPRVANTLAAAVRHAEKAMKDAPTPPAPRH